MRLNKIEQKLIEYFSTHFNQKKKIGIFCPGEIDNTVSFMSADVPTSVHSFSGLQRKIYSELEEYMKSPFKFSDIYDNLEEVKISYLKNIPLNSIDFQSLFLALYIFKEAEDANFGQNDSCPIIKFSVFNSIICKVPFFPLKNFDYPIYLRRIRRYIDENHSEYLNSFQSLEDWYLFFKENLHIGFDYEFLDFSDHKEDVDILNANEERVLHYLKKYMESTEEKFAFIKEEDEKNVLFVIDYFQNQVENIYFAQRKNCKEMYEELYSFGCKVVNKISLDNIDIEALLKALMTIYSYNWKTLEIFGKKSLFYFYGLNRTSVRESAIRMRAELEENVGIKFPDLEDLYIRFKKEPYYGMKIKKLN